MNYSFNMLLQHTVYSMLCQTLTQIKSKDIVPLPHTHTNKQLITCPPPIFPLEHHYKQFWSWRKSRQGKFLFHCQNYNNVIFLQKLYNHHFSFQVYPFNPNSQTAMFHNACNQTYCKGQQKAMIWKQRSRTQRPFL